MQTPPISSPVGYDLLIFLAVCALAVAFLMWFLIALIFDARKATQRRNSWYLSHPGYWVCSSADQDLEEEDTNARHILDSCDDRIFRDLDRLRPLLRSREV